MRRAISRAGGAEQRAGVVRGARGEEDAVARLGADGVGEPGPLGLGEVLDDRSALVERAVLADQHVRQAAGAALLGPLLPGVELTPGLARAARHDDGADVGVLEHPELVSREVRR